MIPLFLLTWHVRRAVPVSVFAELSECKRIDVDDVKVGSFAKDV